MKPRLRQVLGWQQRTSIWLQLALIVAAMVLGLLATLYVINHLLIRAAITEEAAYVWEKIEQGKQNPLPDTRNLQGVLFEITQSDSHSQAYSAVAIYDPGRLLFNDAFASKLRELSSGFKEFEGGESFNFAFVDDQAGQRLVLLFNAANVRSLVTWFGIIPLAAALLLIYGLSYLSYRQVQRYASPFSELARKLEKIDLEHPKVEPFDLGELRESQNRDIRILTGALDSVNRRLLQFVEREKNFTRDASHEIRTPITVIRMAVEMLKADEDLNSMQIKSLSRVERAAYDIEELVAVLLTLSREQDGALDHQLFEVAEILEKEVERCQEIFKHKNIVVRFQPDNLLRITSSDTALKILVGNLLRNACNYTDDGEVKVVLSGRTITIQDTGRGMSQDEVSTIYKPYVRGGDVTNSGYGIGLSIVKRLADRFMWKLELISAKGEGSIFTLTL